MSGNNLPSMQMGNYATSAMVTLPLNEVDALRADLMKINAELGELQKKQKLVRIDVREEYQATKYRDVRDRFGDRTRTPYIDSDWKELAPQYINLDDVIDKITIEHDAKVQSIKNQYYNDLGNEKKLMDDEKKKFKDHLIAKYNGEALDELSSELESVYSQLKTTKESLFLSEDVVTALQKRCDAYEHGFSAYNEIEITFDKYDALSSFEMWVRGGFKEIYRIIQKYTRKNESAKNNNPR